MRVSNFTKCNVNVSKLKCIWKCIKIHILKAFKCKFIKCKVNAWTKHYLSFECSYILSFIVVSNIVNLFSCLRSLSVASLLSLNLFLSFSILLSLKTYIVVSCFDGVSIFYNHLLLSSLISIVVLQFFFSSHFHFCFRILSYDVIVVSRSCFHLHLYCPPQFVSFYKIPWPAGFRFR